jgi:membrane protein implicated in regulation of membrane protease activity
MGALSDFILAHAVWGWMAVGAVFLAIEVATGSGWLLWPAGSAALTGLITLFAPINQPEQIAVFGVLTIITTYVGRRYLRGAHRAAATDVNNPLLRLVGHRGEAVADFEGGDGRVFVDGKEWSAVLDGAGPMAAGGKVEVVDVVGGARLKVKSA